MTDEKRSSGAISVRHSSIVIGCHVLCHSNAPVGIVDAEVPMFAPKVNNRSKRWKKSTYHGSALAIASWVKAGSESMNALWGMRAYSSRQNHEPPDKFRNKSAPRQYSRTCSALRP